MKLLLDIPKNINEELKVFRIRQKLKNMQEGVIMILAEKFKIKNVKY